MMKMHKVNSLNYNDYRYLIVTCLWLLQESQYAKWMAACRLAAKGRSLADASYEAEVASIQSFLQMQHPSPMPAINPASLDILPEEYVAPRYFKKLKSKVKPFIQYLAFRNLRCQNCVLYINRNSTQKE